MVNIEKIENIKEPQITIHFLMILSAKYPKISIVTPERKVNDAVKIPNGNVFSPKPKYAEMMRRFGEIMFETELISVTVAINNIRDNFGRLFDFFSMNYHMLIFYKSILFHRIGRIIWFYC